MPHGGVSIRRGAVVDGEFGAPSKLERKEEIEKKEDNASDRKLALSPLTRRRNKSIDPSIQDTTRESSAFRAWRS